MRFGAITFAILLVSSLHAATQECNTLQSRSPGNMASYLSDTTDRRQNTSCIAFAIKTLGEQRYEPAIPILTKFLDFRWPVGAHQKQMRLVLERDKLTIYPAADALEKMGQASLPAILAAMQKKSTSRAAMEVAVSVWMTIHKDNAPLGVSLLKQEADNATDPFSKHQLEWATFLAATGWCDRSEQVQCDESLRIKASK
jgi:hypothetical protein